MQKAWTEIKRLQNEKPTEYVQMSTSFQRHRELEEYCKQLENSHRAVDVAIYEEPRKGLWLVGDQAETCIAQIYQHFPDIISKTTTAKPEPIIPALFMMVDTDVQKYIMRIHSYHLEAIAQKHHINFAKNEMDDYAEFILKGQGANEAEKEIAHLVFLCQNQLRAENVPVTRVISKTEIEIMNKEFLQERALVEYDKAHRCIHIIAHRTNVQHVKEKLMNRFAPKPAFSLGRSTTVKTSKSASTPPSGSVPVGSSATKPAAGKAAESKAKASSKHDPPDPASFQVIGPVRNLVTITILEGDITKLNVDAIVNTANSRLQNDGGMAGAIATAAGPRLQQECDDHVVRRGKVDVTKTVVTNGFNLPCQKVFHAVVPNMHYYKHNELQCYQDLEETFRNILKTAQQRGFKNIALPDISSGK